MNKIESNKYFYFGDVNPECGGVVYTKLENGSIEAYEIGEYSPINYCYYVCCLVVNEDYETEDQLQEAYYNGGLVMESYSDFKYMKAIDKEFTNMSDFNVIDKFVRYDYNVWNLLRKYIGTTKKIYTYNGMK